MLPCRRTIWLTLMPANPQALEQELQGRDLVQRVAEVQPRGRRLKAKHGSQNSHIGWPGLDLQRVQLSL